MAQQAAPLDRETFSCPICGDLLKDPVTLPCGHSYCLSCTKSFGGDDQGKVYSCPWCTQTFIPRLVLEKNTLLAASVEQLNKTGNQAAAAADPCYAGAGDVSCDVCPDDAASIKLLCPSENPQENICSRHHEVMEMFCRTDQICHLCPMDEHKGHNIVSAAAERAERQKELEVSRQNIQQRIQDREEDVKLLQKEVEAVDRSADKALKDSEKIFTEMIYLIQKRRTEAKQQIRSLQETKVRGVKEIQEKLQQEITELKMKDAELNLLSLTEEPNQFLHSYPSLSQLSEPTSSIEIPPVRHFEDVTAALSELRDKLQEALRDTWANIPLIETKIISGTSLEQWKPFNPGEKKWYDREFLLALQFSSASMNKPEGLPNIKDVVLDKKSGTSDVMKDLRDMWANIPTIETKIISGTSLEQWKPFNPGEKKWYDREFLLALRFSSASMNKPEGLPNIRDVVLDKKSGTSDVMKDLRDMWANIPTIETKIISGTSLEQWKPLNPGEKKWYDREFLLALRFSSASMNKPEGLPKITDVVLDKKSGTSYVMKDLSRRPGMNCSPGIRGGRGAPSGMDMGPSMSLGEDEGDSLEKDSEQYKTQELFKQLRSILNKVTPQNFIKLMKQVTELAIDTEERLKGVN